MTSQLEAPGLELLLDEFEVSATVHRLADELSERHEDGVVLIAVLRGSIPFLADLARAMSIRSVVDFVALTSYTHGAGRVRMLMDVTTDLTDREVVLVEEIVDTGLTSAFLLSELGRRHPRSLSICTLINRPARRVVPVELDHVGIEIPDRYVIGYGLDHQGRYRNLRVLATADTDVLAEDPDAYVEALYGV
jgi:hypoxanthine phosphoribosyltransferase